jgi:hypothetical protein
VDFPRFTHRLRMDRSQLEHHLGELYIDIDPDDLDMEDGEESPAQEERDRLLGLTIPHYDIASDYTLFEMHVWLSLDEDPITMGEPAPYILTLTAGSGKVLALYRGWTENDPTYRRVMLFNDYKYNPGMGGYGLGLIHMVGSSSEGATVMTRQLVDAGTLNNLQAGYKSSDVRVKGDNTPLSPGEMRDADTSTGKLADGFFIPPYKEPSAVLVGLTKDVVSEARTLVGLNDIRPADMSSQAPVGTTLALLERALKPISAVQSRIHRYMQVELRLLQSLIRENYDLLNREAPLEATPEDLARFDVEPVSDLNASTMTQRIAQFQMITQLASQAPDEFDINKLVRYGLKMIGFPATDQVMKVKEDAVPQDPITENAALLTSTSVKAFMFQDHAAHMACHQALRDDPLVQQLIGQSPKANEIMAAWDAHQREHAAMMYVTRSQALLGTQLPPSTDPQSEAAMADSLAQASQIILQQNQATAAQQQAEQAAQDPVLQAQQDELRIKQGELLLDAKKHDDNTKIKIMELLQKTDAEQAKQLLALVSTLSSAMTAQPVPPSAESLPKDLQQ